MAGFIAAMTLSLLNIAASVLHQVDRLQLQYADCDDDVNTTFISECKLLHSDPGDFLEVMGNIVFRKEDGHYCLSRKIQQTTTASLTVKASYDAQPKCCTSTEKDYIATRKASGVPADRAAAIFGSINNRTFLDFSFYEVVPKSCSTGGAGCPLVVEISGAGGHPWAIALTLCQDCKAHMNVVMIAPILGADEDTGVNKVMPIVDWVSAYIKEAANVNPRRVYLASVSRGNEIAIQAAIYGAHMFKAAVLTGKFKIPNRNTFESTWRQNGDHYFTGSPLLKRVVFNIGDEDDVLTDDDFYSHFHDMTTVMADAYDPPVIDLFLYRGAGHDITWTTWNEMYRLLWTNLY